MMPRRSPRRWSGSPDDAALRQRFGAASRALVETDLAAEAVGAATVALYRELLAETG